MRVAAKPKRTLRRRRCRPLPEPLQPLHVALRQQRKLAQHGGRLGEHFRPIAAAIGRNGRRQHAGLVGDVEGEVDAADGDQQLLGVEFVLLRLAQLQNGVKVPFVRRCIRWPAIRRHLYWPPEFTHTLYTFHR